MKTEKEIREIVKNTFDEKTLDLLKHEIYRNIETAKEDIGKSKNIYDMTVFIYSIVRLYKNLSLYITDEIKLKAISEDLNYYKEMLNNIRICIQYIDEETGNEIGEYPISMEEDSYDEQPSNTYTVKNGDNITISSDFNINDKICITPENDNSITANINGYEFVNQPSHYNMYDMPVIDMMEKIWGPEDAAKWCKMTAWKYRQRMGTKPGESVQKDLDKEKWYLDKTAEIEKDIKAKSFINPDEERIVLDCYLKRLNIIAGLDEKVKYEDGDLQREYVEVSENNYNKMFELADELVCYMKKYGYNKYDWAYNIIKSHYKKI